MPWIREATVTDAREEIVPGAYLVRRFWQNEDPAHRYLGSFFTAQQVSFDDKGWVAITTHYYEENDHRPKKMDFYYRKDDVVAICRMNGDTYADHDDRLIVQGGYLNAQPGTCYQYWGVFTNDDIEIATGVSTAEGRALIAAR